MKEVKQKRIFAEHGIQNTGFYHTMSLIKGKYKLPILYCLYLNGPTRYNELKRLMETATFRSLTAGKASKKTVKLNWNKVKTADGYDVYRASKKSGRYIKVKSVSSNTCTDKKLKRGKTCYYKVRAYSKVNGKKLYGGFSAQNYTARLGHL